MKWNKATIFCVIGIGLLFKFQEIMMAGLIC